MRYFVGVGLLAIGVALFYTGQAHKKRVLAAFADFTSQGEPLPTPPLHSLATFGEMMKFLILFILCGLALVVTFGYLIFDGGQYLSYFDVTGALVAIAGYGFWVSMKTEHRMSDLDWRQSSEAATLPDQTPPVDTPAMEKQGTDARAAAAPADALAPTAASTDQGATEPVATGTSIPDTSPADESAAPEMPADAQATQSASAETDTMASPASGAAAAKRPTTAGRKIRSVSSPAGPGKRRSRQTRPSPRKPQQTK